MIIDGIDKATINKINITTLDGKNVFHNSKLGNNRIEVGHLASGSYILTIKTTKEEYKSVNLFIK